MFVPWKAPVTLRKRSCGCERERMMTLSISSLRSLPGLDPVQLPDSIEENVVSRFPPNCRSAAALVTLPRLAQPVSNAVAATIPTIKVFM